MSRHIDWMKRAKCQGMDLNLFFLIENSEEAKQVCETCPVKKQCAEFGKYEETGVFGGEWHTEATAERNRPMLVCKSGLHSMEEGNANVRSDKNGRRCITCLNDRRRQYG